jgi:hypothetical protein
VVEGDSSSRRLNADKSSTTAECTLLVSSFLPVSASLDDDDIFECELDPSDSDGIQGLSLPLDLSRSQKNVLRDLLRNGRIIPGQSKLEHGAGRRFNSKKFFIPPGFDVAKNVRQNKSQSEIGTRRLGVTGTKSILVVRVTDSSNLVHTDSAVDMSANIFGSASDTLNLKSQMNDCSMGNLSIVEGDLSPENEAAPGVLDVTINIPLEGSDRAEIRNAITTEVQTKLGITLPGPYANVLYILEGCYSECGWAGYAYVNSWNSVYQGNFYKNVGVGMHEIGHNFGLGHSGNVDGQTYSDHTGYMGNPLTTDEVGRLCFNAAKSWQLGWYSARHRLLSPISLGPGYNEELDLVGIADFGNSNDQVTPVLLKLETNTGADHFVAFNRATGVNGDVTEARDLVTVVRVNQNDGVSLSQSYVDGFLESGDTLTISNFGGTNIDLDIKVLSIDLNSNPAKARVSVKYGDFSDITSSPSLAPSLSMSPTTTYQSKLGKPLNYLLASLSYADSNGGGYSVTMNDDGSVIAVAGVLYDTSTDLYTSNIMVFKEVAGGGFTTVGPHSGITEPSIQASPYFRDAIADISLSAIGDRLAVGNVKLERNGNSAAFPSTVKIYSHNLSDLSSEWTEDAIAYTGNAGGGGYHMGLKVAFNKDGDILAIGERYFNSGDLDETGRVSLKAISKGGTSSQVTDLVSVVGSTAFEHYGSSIAVGTHNSEVCVLVGAPGADSAPIDNGKAEVFCVNDSSVVTMRPALYGDDTNGEFGHSVAISSDVSVIAVGARHSDQNGMIDNGLVRLFSWNGSAYEQRGADLYGERGEGSYNGEYYVGDEFGYSLAMTDVIDGNIRLAIGAPKSDALGFLDEEYYTGSIYVFEISIDSSNAEADWTSIGPEIAGTSNREKTGQSVAITKNGKRIVVNPPSDPSDGETGTAVRIYEETDYTFHPSGTPSNAPSISKAPTSHPTPSLFYLAHPSARPSVTTMPSFSPSRSSEPSVSSVPTSVPTTTARPSISSRPSESPLGSYVRTFTIRSEFEKFDASRNWCLTANLLAEGSKIHVRPCNIQNPQDGLQLWIATSTGQLMLSVDEGNDLCMTSNGKLVYLDDCNASENGKFTVLGNRIKHVKNGSNYFVGFDPESKYERVSLYREGSLVPTLYVWTPIDE